MQSFLTVLTALYLVQYLWRYGPIYPHCNIIATFFLLTVPSFMIFSLLTWFLTVLYSADCAFSSFTFHSFLHRRVLSFFFPLFLMFATHTPFLLYILLLVYPVAYVYFVWLDRRLVIYKEDGREPWEVRLYIGYGYLAEEVTSLDSPLLFCHISLFAWPATFIRTSSDLHILIYFPLW